LAAPPLVVGHLGQQVPHQAIGPDRLHERAVRIARMGVTVEPPAVAHLDRRGGRGRQPPQAFTAVRILAIAEQECDGPVAQGRVSSAGVRGADQDRSEARCQRGGDPHCREAVTQGSRELEREDVALQTEQLSQSLHRRALQVGRRRGRQEDAADTPYIGCQRAGCRLRRQGDGVLVGTGGAAPRRPPGPDSVGSEDGPRAEQGGGGAVVG
jgi:hypothetical protein